MQVLYSGNLQNVVPQLDLSLSVSLLLCLQETAGTIFPLRLHRSSNRCQWAGHQSMQWMKMVMPLLAVTQNLFLCICPTCACICYEGAHYFALCNAVKLSVRLRHDSVFAGNLWYRHGVTPSYPQGSSWEHISNNVRKVSVGPLDQVCGVTQLQLCVIKSVLHCILKDLYDCKDL